MMIVAGASGVAFVLCSFVIGSPETMYNTVTNDIILGILSFMVLIGCHNTESRKRDRFVELYDARQQVVTEKVARFSHGLSLTYLET